MYYAHIEGFDATLVPLSNGNTVRTKWKAHGITRLLSKTNSQDYINTMRLYVKFKETYL